MSRISSIITSVIAFTASVFEPKSVSSSIMGVFNKTVVKLEKLADKKYNKADKCDNRILDLETSIAMLAEESMDLDREAEEALAAADRIRALIGNAA